MHRVGTYAVVHNAFLTPRSRPVIPDEGVLAEQAGLQKFNSRVSEEWRRFVQKEKQVSTWALAPCQLWLYLSA